MKTAKQAFAAGHFNKAAAAFEKAAALDPTSKAAFFNLGVACKKAGATGKAVAAFKEAARRGHQKAMNLLASQNIDW